MYEYKAQVVRVLDGDTFEAIIDLGFHTLKRTNIRVHGIDTPETWRPKSDAEAEHGERATELAKELLEGKEITLQTVKHGKYRWGGRPILADGRDYVEVMLALGMEKRDSYE